MTEIALHPYVPSSMKVLSSEVQNCSDKAAQHLAGWLVSWTAISWKNAVCWRTASLSCPVWFTGWERRSLHALPACLEMEVRELPQIQHTVLLGLFWHSHGCLPGVYWWYKGEPNGSGCHRNNPFVEVITPPACKTEDMICDRQSRALRFCRAFCGAQAHFPYQIICCLLTEHVGMQLVAVVSL